MGRFLGVLAGVVSLARLCVDALQVIGDLRHGRAPTDADRAPDVGGATEAWPPNGPGGVGQAGPEEGAGAGQERAGTDGAVTSG